MPLKNYGVLKGRPSEYHRGTPSNEHFQVLINRGNDPHRIAINTKSNVQPSQLLYYSDSDFKHEITNALTNSGLSDGFTPLQTGPGGLALDFIRRNLFDVEQMKPLPPQGPKADDDLNDQFEYFISQAIDSLDSVVYAFGEHWTDHVPDKIFPLINPSKGIHDIHMNQGNPMGRYSNDNGVWQDGGILIHYPSAAKWAAVFTAFQSQSFHTDDQTGHPLGDYHHGGNNLHENQYPVRIIAGLINPKGDDTGKEFIILLNKGPGIINLNGWQILDKFKNADTLANIVIQPHSTLRVELTGKGAQLSNKGSNITLLSPDGLKVDGVTYTKDDASVQDIIIEL